MKTSMLLSAAALAILGYGARPVAPAPTSAPGKIDFDRDVRPILSQHCYKCHGPDVASAAGGLRLDSRTGAMASERVIVSGSPDNSFLIKRVTKKQMPPSDSGLKLLTPAEIQTLRTWISEGATYNQHWAYVPPKMPALPTVGNAGWVKNPVDRFVLAKLESAQLKPEPEASRDALALRAAQTLTGLPPSSAELEKFRNDARPGAYERYVDRLLQSSAYGEHQARYWLDAVRYADTHGLQLDNERGVSPYREWVIRAFNQDLPFDKFVEWQLGGDLLPNPTTEQRIATGYVRMNLTTNEGGAIAEEFLARNTFDRVDTTSTVMLGLTVQCAKCHDHKYDPIKQRDYYGLYAFFNSTKDAPLDGNITYPPPAIQAPSPAQAQDLAKLAELRRRIEGLVDPSTANSFFEKNSQPVPRTLDLQVSPLYSAADFHTAFDRAEDPEPGHSGRVAWRPLPFETGKDYPSLISKDNTSVYVRATVELPRESHVTFSVASDDAEKVWLNGKLIHSHKISRGLDPVGDVITADFAAGSNALLIKVINGVGPDGLGVHFGKGSDARVTNALTAYHRNKLDSEPLRTAYLELGPDSATAKQYRQAVRDESALTATIPMTLVAEEMNTPRPTFILKRGQYDQRGDAVSRHLPAVLGNLPTGAKVDRLAFARWLTSDANPLLARVFVNRAWQQHFGTGIVKTVDDFGSQGEWPANQPLLDYLAVSFERSHWSVKQLNRMIVTSAAFRQSSRITPAKLARDPENRLISRGPRFRLDAEVIRDKALVAGGLLVRTVGGASFKPYQPDGIWEGASDPASGTHIYRRDRGPAIYRRSVYMFWKRTAPPPAMLNFDAPLRDTCTVRRASTNTPLQALTTENEVSYLEASRTMAQRLLLKPANDATRLRRAFDLTFARAPRPSEMTLLEKALERYRSKYVADEEAARRLVEVGDAPAYSSAPVAERAAWMIVCSTLMNTDEFLTQH